MNHKILHFIKREGWCCLWAFLEANRRTYTLQLVEKLQHIVGDRAIRHARAKHRRGIIVCPKCPGYCLKDRIAKGFPLDHTIEEHRDKQTHSDVQKEV